MEFHDWTATFNNGHTYSNSSSAGTISGSSHAFAADPGSWGIPTAITPHNMFSNEFQIHGITGLGGTANFYFSPGYKWGSGGQMIIGNIHEYYEYTISAWDFANQPINVNTWGFKQEFASTAPGTVGYFSTSSTILAPNPDGVSEDFSVNDPNASPNFGQGGVVCLGGLKDVGRIQLTLTSSDLGPNAQQVDLMLFNVATPTPEPGTLALLGSGVLGLGGLLRRRLVG